jgi:MFS family permease
MILLCPSTACGLPAWARSRLRSVARTFNKSFWIFFSAAFCMDLGFGLFFFLFNLYLADLHYDEKMIGHTMACLTLGNVIGTLPATIYVRRKGLSPLLRVTFLCAPLLCVLRVLIPGVPAQLLLAFVTGMALCGWPICFSPTIAALTNQENRALGFSITFATGIGVGTLAGLAGGAIPQFLSNLFPRISLVGGIRVVLLASCAITLLGLLPLRFLHVEQPTVPTGKRKRLFHPFLLQFLPGYILWSIVIGSFPMFGAVYLQNQLHVPLVKLGTVFSASELLQFVAVLLAPLLFRRLGTNKGVAIAQGGSALFLASLAMNNSGTISIGFYLLYFASQFMCEPGIYKMLMDSVPEVERSTASAIQNVSGALCQAGTTAITGTCIVLFGYRNVLLSDAAIAVLAALWFFLLRDAAEPEPVRLAEANEEPDLVSGFAPAIEASPSTPNHNT